MLFNPNKLRRGIIVPLLLALVSISSFSVGQFANYGQSGLNGPEAELHIARMIFDTGSGMRRWGGGRPWWAIDYPEAEFHITRGVRRLTVIDIAEDSVHLDMMSDEIFDFPWLFIQQPGRWILRQDEIQRLREYIDRGGFVVLDDFHGPYDWQSFKEVMDQLYPERSIERIPLGHEVLHVLYDLDTFTQIPGRRHLYRNHRGEIDAQLAGPQEWFGVHDQAGRLVMAINFNMDMGDAWQHADDPVYPEPMTALAYRFGVNYFIYAMTH